MKTEVIINFPENFSPFNRQEEFLILDTLAELICETRIYSPQHEGNLFTNEKMKAALITFHYVNK